MIIISNKPGQLGNRLFVFSNWIAYAIEEDETILNPAFDEYAEFFNGTFDQKISRYPIVKKNGTPIPKRSLLYNTSYKVGRVLHKLNIKNPLISYRYLDWEDSLDLTKLGKVKTKYFFAQGWLFRSNNWLDRHRETIISFFDIVEPYRSNVNSFIAGLRANHQAVIGIHIRHGDYETFEDGRYFYTIDQYRSQISKLYNQLRDRNPIFVICSNVSIDINEFGDLPCVSGPGHFVEDMYALSKCDYISGPPSTFTMWASFYGDVPLKFIKDVDATPTLDSFEVYNFK